MTTYMPTSQGSSSFRDDGAEKTRRPSRPSVQTGITTGIAFRVHQLTPPETPTSPQDAADSEPAQGLFHNYLRAFYPFDRSSNLLEGDDALLMTATIKPGDLILVHSVHANGWADGTVLTTGERGWLPTNYCEAYDHPYLRNLLNAMTQFWDLLGANEDANLSTFVRQDYIRGLIAGVRYLLEHADCLHRDAALVLRNSGIRRMRKGLLADLSSLVQIAKGLQETISEPFAGEVIHYLLEDLIAKAFKVLTRAVGFVDMWAKETSESLTDSSAKTVVQDPPTPPHDMDTLAIDTKASSQPGLSQPMDSAKFLPPQKDADDQPDTTAGAEHEADDIAAQSPHLSAGTRLGNATLTHRLSLIENERPSPSALVSTRLAKVHDACISHIGAFIGHHLHSRPSSELVETTERLVNSCKGLLIVVDEVQGHDTGRSRTVQQARNDFQSRLEELVQATKDVFRFSDFDDSDVVMLPEQTNRLVTAGTSLIRTAGECVTKTRALIEQIGDFELGSVPQTPEGAKTSSEEASRNLRKSIAAQSKGEARHMTSFEKRLSKKLLPPVPSRSSVIMENTEANDFATASPITASDTSSPLTPFSPISPNPLPPSATMHRRSVLRMSQQGISGASLRSRRSSMLDGPNAARKDSVGISIAGSTDTYRSSTRDSGISAVSEVSTRATTPDRSKDKASPESALLNSFTSMSSMRSTATDSGSDPETLLQRTYASELTLNKDGQVTGGSLPALIEQLTTHDSAPDPQFVSAFYLTFRMFTTPRDFAQALIARFDYVGDSKAVGTPVRLRIYNVFKGWLETYWNAAADKDALGEIRYFALHKLKNHLPSAGDRLLELTRKVALVYQNGTVTGPLVSGVGKTSTSITALEGQRGSTPEPAVTKGQLNALRTANSGGAPCNILDVDPLELARQITLVTSEIFCAIQPEELLSLEWGKSGTETARNVRAMCTINTDLAHVVGDTVLAPDDAKKRAAVIKHWSKVAARCIELNNYDSLMAIMCSINSSVVSRLKRTWELVSKNTKTRLAELNAVIDFSRNQASLRRRLETPVAPCIPFLGIYLTDLTFLDAGNPKTRELPGAASEDGKPVSVINFDKHMRMAKVITHLQKFQVPYKLQPVPEMQAWMEVHLQRMRAGNEDMVCHFHRRSLTVEPKQEDVRPLNKTDSKRTESGFADDRPKTGNKEKLESFLKLNGFM